MRSKREVYKLDDIVRNGLSTKPMLMGKLYISSLHAVSVALEYEEHLTKERKILESYKE